MSRSSPWIFSRFFTITGSGNNAVSTITDNAPECIRQLPQWVAWKYVDRDGKPTKAPVNPRTGKPYGPTSDKYRAWASALQADVITSDMAARIEAMHGSVQSHEIASRLLASGVAEGVIRTEYCGVPCQIRMDFLNPAEGLVDLKTCDDLTWFEHDARRYGYPYQLSFYRSVFTAAVGEEPPVYLVAVEKKEPFRCGVWRVGDDVLGIAKSENEQAIERLKKCYAQDRWPTGYEEMRTFDSI